MSVAALRLAGAAPGDANSGAPDPHHDRLDSWKEIAGYLGRGVRTVQRWEREEGLPTRRHVHSKQASVYALRSEIEAWRRSREQTPKPIASILVVVVLAEGRSSADAATPEKPPIFLVPKQEPASPVSSRPPRGGPGPLRTPVR